MNCICHEHRSMCSCIGEPKHPSQAADWLAALAVCVLIAVCILVLP